MRNSGGYCGGQGLPAIYPFVAVILSEIDTFLKIYYRCQIVPG